MKRLIVYFAALIAAVSSHAFSLRGPLEPWMTTNLNYGRYGDFGGPMAPGNEYRWNLPVLTYGFDQSFLDFFGERGVQAVEEAVAILNALPPASEMDVDLFPYDTRLHNGDAEVLALMDLKSAALGILVQQLGLAEPESYMWTLRSRQATTETTNYVVIQRNYDPATLRPTSVINGTEFTYATYEFKTETGFTFAAVPAFPSDPMTFEGSAVAQYGIAGQKLARSTHESMGPGWFYTGLTRDDAGGLRFLYHPTNINTEPLPAGVTTFGTNARPTIGVAPRPGVDKITFTRVNWDSNRLSFVRMTNVFVDVYHSNGVVLTQRLQRIIDRPDITFRAQPLGFTVVENAPYGEGFYITAPPYRVSGVSSWLNNAALHGDPNGPGPGTIPGPRSIEFSTQTGRWLSELRWPTSLPYYMPSGFGSFDHSTNAPVGYGNDVATSATMASGIVEGSFVWKVLGTYNAVYRIDCTTNLVDWSAVTTLTNTLGSFSITNSASGPQKFYRAIRTSLPVE
jgi:hypothetical protein